MEEGSEDSFSFEDDSLSSERLPEPEVDLDEKIYEMQMRLGQSKKNIPEEDFQQFKKTEKEIKKEMELKKKKIREISLSKRLQMKEINDILKLAEDQNEPETPKIRTNNWLPQINFEDYKV